MILQHVGDRDHTHAILPPNRPTDRLRHSVVPMIMPRTAPIAQPVRHCNVALNSRDQHPRACPLKSACCPGRSRRQINLVEHEELLLGARQAPADPRYTPRHFEL